MKLLQEQYPDQNGLSNPILLLADYSWKSNGLDNFVQIINVSKQHWVCVSNINVFLTSEQNEKSSPQVLQCRTTKHFTSII